MTIGSLEISSSVFSDTQMEMREACLPEVLMPLAGEGFVGASLKSERSQAAEMKRKLPKHECEALFLGSKLSYKY